MNYLNVKDGLPRGRWSSIQIWDTPDAYAEHRAQRLFFDMKGYLDTLDIVVPKLLLPDFPNGITDVGIHYLLDAGFRGTAQISTWYAGIIDNSGYSGVAASDTMASHSGWTEITTQYDESVRQTLSFGAAATRLITATVSFTMNASKTIQGLFVNSDNVKGGTAGTLWSTAIFPSPPALVSGNVLTAIYTLTD